MHKEVELLRKLYRDLASQVLSAHPSRIEVRILPIEEDEELEIGILLDGETLTVTQLNEITSNVIEAIRMLKILGPEAIELMQATINRTGGMVN